MEPRLPEDPAKLRALLPEVMSLIRSRRAALQAELAGLGGGHAPAAANSNEPAAAELECEENPAALQQLVRQALSQWYRHRSVLEAAIAVGHQERDAAEAARAAAQKRAEAAGAKRRRQPAGEEQGNQERWRKRPSTSTCATLGELYQKYVIVPQTCGGADASSTTAEQGTAKESVIDTSNCPRTSGGNSGKPGAAARTVAAFSFVADSSEEDMGSDSGVGAELSPPASASVADTPSCAPPGKQRRRKEPQRARGIVRQGPPMEDFLAVAHVVVQATKNNTWVKPEHIPYVSDFVAHLVAASFASPARYEQTPPGYNFLSNAFPHPNGGARHRTQLAGELVAALGPELRHQIFGLTVWRFHNTAAAKDVLQPLLDNFRADENTASLRSGLAKAYAAGPPDNLGRTPSDNSYLFSADGLRGGPGGSYRNKVLVNLDAWWQTSQRLAAVLAKPDTEPRTWHAQFLEEIFERTPCYGNYWAKFLYGDIGSHLAGSKADLAGFTVIGPGCFEMFESWGLVFQGSVTERQRQGLEGVNELRLVVQAIFQTNAHPGIQCARDAAGLQEPSAYDLQVQCCEEKRGLREKLHSRLASTRKPLSALARDLQLS